MSDSTKETSINNKSSSSVSEALTNHLEKWYWPKATLLPGGTDSSETNYNVNSIVEQLPVGLERVP
jgi:hypothetical protein